MGEGTLMPLDHFRTIRFGWLRGWKPLDHVVILGYNKGEKKYFMLEQRKVNAYVRDLRSSLWPDAQPALTRAQLLFGSCDVHNYMEARFKYCGTLEMSDTAQSFRHFVFVTARGIEDELKTKFGYNVLDPDDLELGAGHFHGPVIHHLITEYEASRIVV